MLNPRRYKRIDYHGLLGPFIASWLLHGILFTIAATTTIFYPPTADREFISVDLLFASPESGSPEEPLSMISQSSSQPTANENAADDIKTEEPLPVKTAQNEVNSDLELLPVPFLKPEKRKIAPVKITPPPVPRPKIQKSSKPPPVAPVIVPATLKIPEDMTKETVKPATAEVEPSNEMAVQSKTLAQTELEKVAIENDRVRRKLEEEQKAVIIKAEEETKAKEMAQTTELKRQETERAARAEDERIHRQQVAAQKAAQVKAEEEAQAKETAQKTALKRQEAERTANAEKQRIHRQQVAAQKAAQLKAEEEAQARETAQKTALKRQEAERAAKVEKERIHRQQVAAQKAAQERALEESRKSQLARAEELKKLETERAASAKLAAEKAQAKQHEAFEKSRLEQLVLLKQATEKAAREQQARDRALAEKAAKDKLEQARLAANIKKSINTLSAKPAVNSLSVDPAKSAGAVIAAATPEKPLLNTFPPAVTIQPKNQPEHKGFALPPVNGDIKLVISSDEDVTVKVLFVSHPKLRHDRPLTKKETKEQQKLTPIVVRTAKSTLEAVIERSRDGIYIFLVEQRGSKPVNGKFSLKLFETKNKPVPAREISGQTEVARLLMPEGILWEDDSAFSGNIEDSDSITKFNSDSGLVWKEYRR